MEKLFGLLERAYGSAIQIPWIRVLRRTRRFRHEECQLRNRSLLNQLRRHGPRVLRASSKRCYATVLQTNELLYERMFSSSLPRFDIENRYYPVKSAATYSLLYLIFRVVTELRVNSVTELGAGQTTLLLDDLGRAGFEFDLLTLEHSIDWIETVSRQVRHPIQHVPLIERELFGYGSEIYDFAAVNLPDTVELLIVDGPVGRRRKSRWGCLQLIESRIGDDFVIIFDDAERKGELETIERTIELLEARGTRFSIGITESKSCQCLIAGGKFEHAAYF